MNGVPTTLPMQAPDSWDTPMSKSTKLLVAI